MPDAAAMTDLSDLLRSDDGETVRADLVGRFDRLLRQIGSAADTGVTTEEYARLRRIQLAAEAARQVVTVYR